MALDRNLRGRYSQHGAKSIVLLFGLLFWSIQQVPALIVTKDFEELIRAADAIVVARVLGIEPPAAEAPPYQIRRSDDLIPMKHGYRIGLEEVLKGDLPQTEMDISFYDRERLKASYVETGSGIETRLQPGERYLFLLQKMPDSRYEFIRAEDAGRKEEILRLQQNSPE